MLLYASESVLTWQFFDFGVSNGDTVQAVRNLVGLDDVAILVKKRPSKFIDRLVDWGEYGSSSNFL